MNSEVSPSEGFDASREALRQLDLSWSSSRFCRFRDVVIDHAVSIIQRIPDVNFQKLLDIGWAEQLVPVFRGIVQTYLAEFPEGQLVEYSEADFANALVFNLAYWFQEAAHPGKSPGWRMANGVILGGAINDRIKLNKESERQRDFWARLGPITPPGIAVKTIPNSTAGLHDIVDLTPETKANVLRNFMDHANSIGLEAGDGTIRHKFLIYHRRSLEAARRLFASNPELTAGHIIEVMQYATNLLGSCLPSYREEDTVGVLRRCNDLSYLLVMLRQAAKQGDIDIPVARYLTKKELFGPEFHLQRRRDLQRQPAEYPEELMDSTADGNNSDLPDAQSADELALNEQTRNIRTKCRSIPRRPQDRSASLFAVLTLGTNQNAS
jgi:hypothetical protein